MLNGTLNNIKVNQRKFHNISINWSITLCNSKTNWKQPLYYVSSWTNVVQMAYKNVIETVRKCVLGDSLRIRTHSLCSLYSCVAKQPNSGLCCIKFEKFQYHTQLDTYALPLWLPCTRDQLLPDTPTYATHNTMDEHPSPYRVSKSYSQQPSSPTNEIGDVRISLHKRM
jgi:hypothetical protein